MSKVYTLKIDETGEIEYLETDEVLEDIYGAIEALQNELLEISLLLKQQNKENQFNILEDDISFYSETFGNTGCFHLQNN